MSFGFSSRMHWIKSLYIYIYIYKIIYIFLLIIKGSARRKLDLHELFRKYDLIKNNSCCFEEVWNLIKFMIYFLFFLPFVFLQK